VVLRQILRPPLDRLLWTSGCRYMVVLRMGGVYADIDTECRKPLNNLILPRDTLVVGWENEFSTAEEASSRKYVRKRQVSPFVCLDGSSATVLIWLHACAAAANWAARARLPGPA
jgi:hypothetical protein